MSEARAVELDYDSTARRMSILYNPANTASSRTRIEVQPWAGAYEFIVDESLAAGCDKWLVRVRVEWDAGAAMRGDPGLLHVAYELEDFDCRKLMHPSPCRAELA